MLWQGKEISPMEFESMFHSSRAGRTEAWFCNSQIVVKNDVPFFATTYFDSLGVTSEVYDQRFTVATGIVGMPPDHAHSCCYENRNLKGR